MPPTASPILPWIDRALSANDHPDCATIVARGRRQDPPRTWTALARDISQLTGGDVSSQWLWSQFRHLDDSTSDGAA